MRRSNGSARTPYCADKSSDLLFEHHEPLVLAALHGSHRDPWVAVQHGTGDGTAQSNVNFGGASLGDETTDVVGLDAAARHDDNSTASLLDQLRDRFLSLWGCGFAPRGEHAIDARVANLFERAKQVGGHVEGAMERYGERTRQINQLPRSVNVNISHHVQDAEDNAVRTQALGKRDVMPHDFKVIALVTEITGAGTDHDVKGDRQRGPRHFDKAGTGGDSALDQAAADLDTPGAASLGRNCRGDGIDADLNQDVLGGHAI